MMTDEPKPIGVPESEVDPESYDAFVANEIDNAASTMCQSDVLGAVVLFAAWRDEAGECIIVKPSIAIKDKSQMPTLIRVMRQVVTLLEQGHYVMAKSAKSVAVTSPGGEG